ncbi:MAG: histidine triad nucleotide-binding protein [Armatimonadetes bacterium]|nr:histidine triad nucleotide-binding protein [Armatimonadota bacterium]
MDTPITDTIFARIVRGEIPAQIVYETDSVLAFHDIAPQAPVHVVVIPKTPVRDLVEASPDAEMLGQLLAACAEVARITGIGASGFRVVVNTGQDGGQTVGYLHAHVLGGRALSWPPG